MNDPKIYVERSELYLDKIISNDTIADLISKINRNFNLISEFQGGRQGIPGEQGPPGCSTIEIKNFEGDSGDLSFITKTPAINRCAFNDVTNDNDTYFDLISLILNNKANTNFALTNIYKDTNDNLKLASLDLDEESFEVINEYANLSKISILNSDENGNGKHLYFGNSKKFITDADYLCKSGFLLENSSFENNIEIFKLSGIKNLNIVDHYHYFDTIIDLMNISRNENSQKLIIDPGLDENSLNSGRLQLQKQNKENIFRLPDRTGWVGVWEDVLDNEEIWDKIEVTDILTDIFIGKIKYSTNLGTFTKVFGDSNIPVTIQQDSNIRFKRLNNWILIDYNIKIVKDDLIPELNVLTISFINEKNTIECRTQSWHPGSVYNYDTYYDIDILDSTYFKVEPYYTTIGLDEIKTFEINVKSKNISMNEIDNFVYLTGQIWATIENYSTCEPLEIVDNVSCEILQII